VARLGCDLEAARVAGWGMDVTDGDRVSRDGDDAASQSSSKLSVDVGKRSSRRRKRHSRGLGSPISLEALVELDDLKESVERWVANAGGMNTQEQVQLGILVGASFLMSMIFGLFAILVPMTYGSGGFLFYRNKGWSFFQPGRGGKRFVALNAVAWTLYGVSLLLQATNLIVRDSLIGINAFMLGALSWVLVATSLASYHHSGVALPQDFFKHGGTPTFNSNIQASVIMRSQDDSPSFFWWVFVGMQSSLALGGLFLCLLGELGSSPIAVRSVTVLMAICANAIACSTTHALGGKWQHIRTSYTAFQPGRGGSRYVLLQAAGWTAFGVSIVCGLAALRSHTAVQQGKGPSIRGLMTLCGMLGVVAQALITVSLFTFEDLSVDLVTSPKREINEDAVDTEVDAFFLRFVKLQIQLLNFLFGPRDPETATRSPKNYDPESYLECDAKWEKATAQCAASGDRYLVVGNGFVGKRLVNRLLERGETDIRVFDVVPVNHWEGDSRVTFIRGDVTKAEDIQAACEGVHTVYSTFAVIRFMERLEHQAFLSYHVNVNGTKSLLEACQKQNCKRIIVTSSSHATTDEFSEPRFNRDETAELLTRENAHNHYGWTKAIADRIAIEADGTRLANGEEMEITVVRPCSGVFGADDRLSFQRIMDLGVAPGVGAKAVMDWVYVENVVLGHLLAEQALQSGVDGVRGEAFCISNDDPVSMEDFWNLTRKIIKRLPSKKMRKRLALEFVWIPEQPLWWLAYVSELSQRVFKGKVSLGADLDTLTPAMLSTATMTYTYTSAKARRVLGYEPVYSLEDAITLSLHEYYDTKFKAQDPTIE